MKSNRQLGWMWAQACEALERAEKLQRRYVRYIGPVSDATAWEPPVDVQETVDGFLFTFAMPGVEPQHLEVRLDADGLTVSGVRRVRLGEPGSRIRRLEIPQGRFVRRIALAPGRYQVVDPQYVHGCLEVRLIRTA